MLPQFFTDIISIRFRAKEFDAVFYLVVKEFIAALFENKAVPMIFGIEIPDKFISFQVPHIRQRDFALTSGFHEFAKDSELPIDNINDYKVFIDLIELSR